jgi:hypothetical protein
MDGNQLDGVVLRRTNGSLQLQRSFSATLSLDPLTADPILVGTEIRNNLEAAGVNERHCVVCLPSQWALVIHTELPELPEADVAGLLQLEAERGFPSDIATLRIRSSICRAKDGKQFATQIGISANHLAILERAFAAARLKPVGFSLGVTELQPVDTAALTLAIGRNQIDLQITCGGGVAALRTLEGAMEVEGGRRELNADVVAREVRITLGQLPVGFRDAVRRVRVFGPDILARQLVDEMKTRLVAMGLKIELVTAYAADEFKVTLPVGVPVTSAFSFAARRLAGDETMFEFLSPKVAPWKQLARRYTSGVYRTASAIAAAVVILAAGAFLIQEWQLVRLRSQWSKMSTKAAELDGMQEQIRQYRPWFDNSFPCLSILRRLTMAFPDDGVVSAKSIEIRDMNTVTCSGVARDNGALLKTLTQLRAATDVGDLKVDQIRGKLPMQFTFAFHWLEGEQP